MLSYPLVSQRLSALMIIPRFALVVVQLSDEGTRMWLYESVEHVMVEHIKEDNEEMAKYTSGMSRSFALA